MQGSFKTFWAVFSTDQVWRWSFVKETKSCIFQKSAKRDFPTEIPQRTTAGPLSPFHWCCSVILSVNSRNQEWFWFHGGSWKHLHGCNYWFLSETQRQSDSYLPDVFLPSWASAVSLSPWCNEKQKKIVFQRKCREFVVHNAPSWIGKIMTKTITILRRKRGNANWRSGFSQNVHKPSFAVMWYWLRMHLHFHNHAVWGFASLSATRPNQKTVFLGEGSGFE